jgi:hypothetical protein
MSIVVKFLALFTTYPSIIIPAKKERNPNKNENLHHTAIGNITNIGNANTAPLRQPTPAFVS